MIHGWMISVNEWALPDRLPRLGRPVLREICFCCRGTRDFVAIGSVARSAFDGVSNIELRGQPITTEGPASMVADFERRARRFETPCADGSLVWRAWGDGPPVVLAHGAHGAWSHWIRNIDTLAAERTVWAPDLPGYGESALAPLDDQATIAHVIAAGLRQLIASEIPVDIVGFSFGGVVAAYLAVLHPELVRRLILVDTGGLDTPLGVVELRRLRGLEGDERRAALRANLLGLMLHHPTSVDELALYLHATNGSRARLNPSRLVLPDKLLEVLPRISAQLDAIWGEHDRPHPDPAIQEKVLRRFHPDLDFRVIADAGHWAMYERPDDFNRTLLDILARPLKPRP
jgi:pimeloyl-ACP methyl ester carboxylesterase